MCVTCSEHSLFIPMLLLGLGLPKTVPSLILKYCQHSDFLQPSKHLRRNGKAQHILRLQQKNLNNVNATTVLPIIRNNMPLTTNLARTSPAPWHIAFLHIQQLEQLEPG